MKPGALEATQDGALAQSCVVLTNHLRHLAAGLRDGLAETCVEDRRGRGFHFAYRAALGRRLAAAGHTPQEAIRELLEAAARDLTRPADCSDPDWHRVLDRMWTLYALAGGDWQAVRPWEGGR